MKRRRSVIGQARGLLVGTAVTLVMVALYAAGSLDSLVLYWLDVGFRHFNRVEPSDRVLMIDITDYAVERIHRWPWPRRLHADLIGALEEFGARVIAMDVVFSEPEPPQINHPALSRDADVDPPQEVHGSVTIEDKVHYDRVLADAVAAGGNVYLALFYREYPPGHPVGRLTERAEELLASDPAISRDEFERSLSGEADDIPETFYDAARLRHLLAGDFSLSRDQLAAALDQPPDVIEPLLAPVKQSVARRLVARVLTDRPDATFAEVRETILPNQPNERLTRDREDVLRAYRSVQALNAALDGRPKVPGTLRGRIEQGTDAVCPLAEMGGAARGVAFVTRSDDKDGVIRRLPLVIDLDGRLVPQLGFAVACDLLGIRLDSLAWDRGRLSVIAASGEQFEIPIGSDGRTLLNWHVDRAEPGWQHSFNHLPVARIMELVENRRTIEQNDARLALRKAEAVRFARGGPGPAYAEYAAAVRKRNELRKLTGQGRSGNSDAEAAEERVAELDKQIEAAELEALQFLEFARAQVNDAQPQSPEEEADFSLIASLSADLLDGELQASINRDNAALRARIEELSTELREKISGKACFVGYTAAATSDFVNMPVYKTAPGVMAHANVTNAVLQNRFPREAPAWINILLMLASGIAVGVVTSSRGPWTSLICIALVIALVMGTSFALFAYAAYYVAAIVAAVTVFVCWAFITLYRQLTEERAKRQFSRALAQYTSPAVAAQIAADADLTDLAPRPRQVTCYFSDLQGFTRISEHLGAQRTRDLLNPYLEAMSRVLLTHNAMINKFMGDGIFAFFNPPILVCEDHARQACEAALDCEIALEKLKADHATGPLADDIRALVMRAGINSGDVFVGDYGSSSKLDYTCIGDAVNLAARLEPANKPFGTRLMISESTRRQLDDVFVLRDLGKLQVVGKEEAVPVYELLGRAGQVDDDDLRYAELFTKAVGAFQRRAWDEADQSLNRCSELRPTDRAIEVYRRQIGLLRVTPPPEDWNQGITLTSK